MPDLDRGPKAAIDDAIRSTADLALSGAADVARLRSAILSTTAARLASGSASLPGAGRSIRTGVAAADRRALLRELEAPAISGEDGASGEGSPVDIIRRDVRETLLNGQFEDRLGGLKATERLGPFELIGGIEAWFDLFTAVRRVTVRDGSVLSPAFVLTGARRPVRRGARTVVRLDAGTVWIRGDLLTATLPAGGYVGFRVTGGSLGLNGPSTIAADAVDIGGTLDGSIRLDIANEAVTPVPGGCDDAKAAVTLPPSITITFGAGGVSVSGDAGACELWGEAFTFGAPTGTWRFVERLWTLVLGYDVAPTSFDPDPIGDDLVTFAGTGAVVAGGLGLPVVQITDPAILGDASRTADWVLFVDGLRARWYSPDVREHDLGEVTIEVGPSGVTIAAEAIQPLMPAVAHAYDLWTIRGAGDHRLPWRQVYDGPFAILYRCDTVTGERLLVDGHADVALDRPVTTNGEPVSFRTGRGIILLSRFDGTVTAQLAALAIDDGIVHQFALANALLWTATPWIVFATGPLIDSSAIDAGDAHLLLGVYGWAPTLPDPYVATAAIQGRRIGRGSPRSVLACQIVWPQPDAASVTFAGALGAGASLVARPRSSGESRPARKSGGQPGVGLTQAQQDARTHDRRTAALVDAAASAEAKGRTRRIAIATGADRKSLAAIDRSLAETVAQGADVLLLDVSTNQDLLGVALSAGANRDVASVGALPGSPGSISVDGLAIRSPIASMLVVTVPQVQWEPVRTLDSDQDIMTMGWFPTPLASATDGGPTIIGARSQRLMPIIPEAALKGTLDAYRDGTPVGVRTTFPFGLVAGVRLQPADAPDRKADLLGLTRPSFPAQQTTGGIQITAQAEGGRPADDGISPMFAGAMRQLLNGVDLSSGASLGLSVLGETLQPAGSVETVFNDDMASRPRVPVTRIDLSGYGGSNFSDWNNPLAAFAEAAKVQFRTIVGRNALEVVKVNSVLHPWGIRVTRSVTIERRSGGGVIRRDSGWQAFTPGLFDYRYFDSSHSIVVAPYVFDAGIFRGLFNVRTIRPAPGDVFVHGSATLVPYYFDADVAIEGIDGRSAASGILGWLQTTPNGVPAGADAIRALIEAQGPVGGPVEAWLDFGGSGLPFRAQRIEVGVADDGGTPLFVATVRGVPKLPTTGSWSVVVRPVASVPPGGGEASTVADDRGTPIVRRYPVAYVAGDDSVYTEPPLAGTPGDYRLADAADLLTPTAPANDYALIQSTPTHAFLFPRPSVASGGPPRIESGARPALADIFARSTSKGAFPPPGNTIELPPGAIHFDVGAAGELALSSPVSIVNHPIPLRLGGSTGHGTALFYDGASLSLDLQANRWEAEFTGLRIWSDISGVERITGVDLRVVGSTEQRSQIAEFRSLLLDDIEEILQYLPIVGARGVQGPIDLGATNAKHELKVEAKVEVSIPKQTVAFPAGAGIVLKLSVTSSAGIDLATGGPKANAVFGAELDGKIPVLSIGVVAVFIIVSGKITFSLTSVSGAVTAEKLDLLAFVGVGVEGKIGPFKAYAFLGVGFVFEYDAVANVPKYGGLVALEAGVDLVIVAVKIRAELKGLVYSAGGKTKCDYSGSVKIEVEIFLIFSISASYEVSETTTF